MSLFTVVQRLLDKAGTGFIEPRREDGHGSSANAPTNVADSGEREYLHKVVDVTVSGDTILITPTAGKRIRIRWIYAINDPVATTSTKMKIRFGTNGPIYNVWALSKRQMVTGGVNEILYINLSNTANVAVTIIYEEIT